MNNLSDIQRMIDLEVERRVLERIKEESRELSHEEIADRFREVFDFMSEKEQIDYLIDLISPGDESLCDSFGEGTHSMSKKYKAEVAITMILEMLKK